MPKRTRRTRARRASVPTSTTPDASPAASIAALAITASRRRAEALVMELMAIRGPSCEEAEVANFIDERLRAAGLPASAISRDGAARRSPHGGETGNLIVRLPGTLRAARRLLMAHMDTVPICVGSRPRRRGGRVESVDPRTGLGADDRAGAAVVLLAAVEILERGLPHPPLTFVWTVQEEIGLVGARHIDVRALGKPVLGFNFDGSTASQVVIGATGAARLTITLEGVASHAGVHPERGASALVAASLAIAELEEDGWHGRIEKGRRRGTSNVGLIEGGGATNVVVDRVVVRAEARSHSAAFRERIVAAYRRAFERAARRVSTADGRRVRVEFDSRVDYDAFALSRREPAARAAAAAIAAAGREPEWRIVDGGLDANWLHVHGVPTVSLGAGQRCPHTVEEWLDLDDFHAAREIALRLATGAE